MNWAGRREFAGIKMEPIDTDHSSVVLGIGMQEFPERLR
jgi:hypothetical protein